MSAEVEALTKAQLRSMLPPMNEADTRTFDECIASTGEQFAGMISGKLVCVWGLCPPTVLSNRAYLWLYVLGDIEAHKFLFVRHSQRVIETALRDYDVIYGVTDVRNTSAIRWIKWLGAIYSQPDGLLAPFTIRHKANG